MSLKPHPGWVLNDFTEPRSTKCTPTPTGEEQCFENALYISTGFSSPEYDPRPPKTNAPWPNSPPGAHVLMNRESEVAPVRRDSVGSFRYERAAVGKVLLAANDDKKRLGLRCEQPARTVRVQPIHGIVGLFPQILDPAALPAIFAPPPPLAPLSTRGPEISRDTLVEESRGRLLGRKTAAT